MGDGVLDRNCLGAATAHLISDSARADTDEIGLSESAVHAALKDTAPSRRHFRSCGGHGTDQNVPRQNCPD
jgi:hypothetical protein